MKLELAIGALLFSFSSKENWINTAQRKFRKCGLHSNAVLCIDAYGRICTCGKDFEIANDDDAFPVKCYAAREELTDANHA
jgi:hypothetical protein